MYNLFLSERRVTGIPRRARARGAHDGAQNPPVRPAAGCSASPPVGGGGGDPAPTRDSEVLFELVGENPENRLFGRFDAAEIRERLAAAGLLSGMAERGYPDPSLSLACADPADQRICLFAGGETSRDRLLFEARMQLAPFHPRHPIGPFTRNPRSGCW